IAKTALKVTSLGKVSYSRVNEARVFRYVRKPSAPMWQNVHHLLIPLLATTPCQVFLPKAFYIATNIPFVFVLFASQFIQIAIVIERCIANVYIKDYETGYKKLGPILISAAMSVCVSILLMLYCGENFDGPVLNARALPTKNIVLVNVVIMVMLAINFTGLALTITLHFVGPKRRIR
ncbi:unnamed protein product, partial [Heligmosomoides polygyrus]|uniref:Neur_chan_memb domain-containing protein n=1 Tax=Heligmosomoides polygyrus TaxID=6339 RepID=A0A183GHN7_HELPZ